jgi:dolichol-phosphate mannosyltransferase
MRRIKTLIPTFSRFLAVGLSGTLVNLALLWLLVNLGMDHLLAALVATEISIINNFFWNDQWTFKGDIGQDHSKLARFFRFQVVASFTAVLTLGLFSVFFQVWHIYYLLAQFWAIGFATLVNFSVNSWLTWGLFGPARLAIASISGTPATVKIVKEIEEC